MARAALEGLELEYEVRGAGEPVVLVHGGVFPDFSTPLREEPALTSRYRVVSYHRIGCAGSSRVAGPVGVAQEAQHCRSLMRHLGIERAHVVGHSNGGILALQLALDAPDAVHSLVLQEPALMAVPSARTARAFVATAVQRYTAGDRAGAIDTFLQGTCGADYRVVLDRVLPGAFDRYVADASTFFGQQLPALQAWSFSREDASRIAQPVLAVIGAKSRELSPIWNERQELLLAWLPNVEPFVLTGAGHLVHVENPRAMARGLAAFFAGHPLPAAA
jgi:pimeloyl-ACP methyl ester carboxylesterase